MKKLLLLLIFTTVIFSCKNDPTIEDRFKEVIEPVLIESLNDPNSYEFVSVSEIDTFYLKESSLKYKKLYEGWVNDYKNDTTAFGKEQYAKHLSEYERYKNILDTVSEKTIDEIGATFKYRAKNQLGGLILAEKRFYFDTHFNIVSVKE
jgi:oligoribonuclease NrnB/cAMP/cGMP phosphodiesterase (DHH superfamily)